MPCKFCATFTHPSLPSQSDFTFTRRTWSQRDFLHSEGFSPPNAPNLGVSSFHFDPALSVPPNPGVTPPALGVVLPLWSQQLECLLTDVACETDTTDIRASGQLQVCYKEFYLKINVSVARRVGRSLQSRISSTKGRFTLPHIFLYKTSTLPERPDSESDPIDCALGSRHRQASSRASRAHRTTSAPASPRQCPSPTPPPLRCFPPLESYRRHQGYPQEGWCHPSGASCGQILRRRPPGARSMRRLLKRPRPSV